MNKLNGLLISLFLLMFAGLFAQQSAETRITDGEYTAVVEGYDWWPAVSKVILDLNKDVTSVNKDVFTISVKKQVNMVICPPNLHWETGL